VEGKTYVALNIELVDGTKGGVGFVLFDGNDEVGEVLADEGLREGLESEEDWDKGEGPHYGIMIL
jgi:hypothetical protein